MLDPAGSRSPFSMHITDATHEQFARFGEEAQKIPPRCSRSCNDMASRWPNPRSVRFGRCSSPILAAVVSLEELGPKSMRGYGVLSPEAAQTLDAEMRDLIAALQRMQSHLIDESPKE